LTESDAIAGALWSSGLPIVAVVMETGRTAHWLYHELARRGVPTVCVAARQAHALLSQMHDKTDADDAAMLADLARTGFYRKGIVKSRTAQERRTLLRAREVAIETRMNIENTIRGLVANWRGVPQASPHLLTAHHGCRGARPDAVRHHHAVAPHPYRGATAGRAAIESRPTAYARG
jgi:transposase